MSRKVVCSLMFHQWTDPRVPSVGRGDQTAQVTQLPFGQAIRTQRQSKLLVLVYRSTGIAPVERQPPVDCPSVFKTKSIGEAFVSKEITG